MIKIDFDFLCFLCLLISHITWYYNNHLTFILCLVLLGVVILWDTDIILRCRWSKFDRLRSFQGKFFGLIDRLLSLSVALSAQVHVILATVV